MEPKKNTANKKRFFLTLLSFCAIPISTAVEAAELQSPRQNPALITEHNYSSRNFTNLPDESDNEVSEKLDPEAVSEEIDLDQEWADLLGNQSEQGFILADNAF